MKAEAFDVSFTRDSQHRLMRVSRLVCARSGHRNRICKRKRPPTEAASALTGWLSTQRSLELFEGDTYAGFFAPDDLTGPINMLRLDHQLESVRDKKRRFDIKGRAGF